MNIVYQEKNVAGFVVKQIICLPEQYEIFSE